MPAEIRPVGRVYAPFSGLPERAGPLTVGQRNVLVWWGRAGHGSILLNRMEFSIPAGSTVDDARAGFSALLARYEALRTTVHLDDDATQRVAGEGQLPIDLYECDEESYDEAVAITWLTFRMRSIRFDLATELPLRVALLSVGGVLRLGAVLCTHVALDVAGMTQAGRELTELIGDPTAPGPAPSWQPLDLAEWELTPAGQRRLDSSLRYWLGHLRAVPHRGFPLPGTPAPRSPGTASGVYWAASWSTAAARRAPAIEVHSPAGAIAVPHIAARTGTTPGMVVVAAFVALLAHRTRQPRCAFVTLYDNRVGNLRGHVGTPAGSGLVVVDAAAGSFDELVRRTGMASLVAARHANLDVTILNRQAPEVFRERGAQFCRDVVVNNVAHALGQARRSAPRPLTDLPAALPSTTRTWVEWERLPQALNFRILSLDEALSYRLGTASVAWGPPDELEALVRGVESVVVAAAGADLDLARLSEISGIAPATPGPGWRNVDGCWVELDHVRQLVADALAPAVTSVFYESTPDGREELVAYLAGGSVRDGREAHERCVAALPGVPTLDYFRYVAITPRRYVVCAGAPEDPTDLAGWLRQTVLSDTVACRSGERAAARELTATGVQPAG